jgi:predicted RND superfamily exporter protein
VEALRRLHTLLAQPWLEARGGALAASVRLLRDELGEFLARSDRSGDPASALESLQHVLLGTLPAQIQRLDRALDAGPVTLADLPPELARRMLASSGEARVQVFPIENVNDEAALERFVDGVRVVWPDATGLAVNFFEFGRATAASMREALTYAAITIALLVWLLWRSLSDALLAMAPLALGSAATIALMAAFGMSFNFANVVVLPLLLGVGVDSGIHLVHRSHGGANAEASLLGSTTARAVLFSAVTTMVSFGSLALSGHRGMHSMGVLLLIGLGLVLAANFVVLPALIAVRAQRRVRRSISAAA